jgi:hypothetical protein
MIKYCLLLPLGLATAASAGIACTPVSSTSGADGGSAISDAEVGGDGSTMQPDTPDAGSPAATVDGGAIDVTGDGEAGSPATHMFIDVSQLLSASASNFQISAAFQADVAGCTSVAIGPCTAVRCVIDPNAGPPVIPAGTSAGDITVVGAGASTATLMFGADAQYSSATGMAGFFSGGDAITLTAAGGAIDAFGPKTLIAPGEVVFTAPACTMGSCPGIDRTVDMPVSWTGGGAGNVQVAIETAAETLSTAVSCVFKATAGTAVVPAGALAMLDQADGNSITALQIMFPIDSVAFTVGEQASVTFAVQSSPTEGMVIVSK